MTSSFAIAAAGSPWKMIASFIMPCNRCRFCVVGRDDLCETFFPLNRLKGALYDGERRLRRADGTVLAMAARSAGAPSW